MLIDLSHTVEHGMITYPGIPGPIICDFLSREASKAHYAKGTTFHIGKTVVTQARDSQYVGTAVALGASLARHNWEIYQTGEQTTTKLYGLGAIASAQHTDTHSLVALNYPHGSVEQLQ